MDIVQPSPDDIGIREAAALAGCCEKTLRRAAHTGQLPLRYASGPRGLALVFAREDLERWLAPSPRRPYRWRSPGRRSGAGRRDDPGGPLLAAISALREEVASSRAALAPLAGTPAHGEGLAALATLDRLQREMAALGRRLLAAYPPREQDARREEPRR